MLFMGKKLCKYTKYKNKIYLWR